MPRNRARSQELEEGRPIAMVVVDGVLAIDLLDHNAPGTGRETEEKSESFKLTSSVCLGVAPVGEPGIGMEQFHALGPRQPGVLLPGWSIVDDFFWGLISPNVSCVDGVSCVDPNKPEKAELPIDMILEEASAIRCRSEAGQCELKLAVGSLNRDVNVS
jgi:hypothetical protein